MYCGTDDSKQGIMFYKKRLNEPNLQLRFSSFENNALFKCNIYSKTRQVFPTSFEIFYCHYVFLKLNHVFRLLF